MDLKKKKMVEAPKMLDAEKLYSIERKEAYKLQIIRRILRLMALPPCSNLEHGAYIIR